jgi:hypothetical protein
MTDDIAASLSALIPKGYLRAAVNLANIALVQLDPDTGARGQPRSARQKSDAAAASSSAPQRLGRTVVVMRGRL